MAYRMTLKNEDGRIRRCMKMQNQALPRFTTPFFFLGGSFYIDVIRKGLYFHHRKRPTQTVQSCPSFRHLGLRRMFHMKRTTMAIVDHPIEKEQRKTIYQCMVHVFWGGLRPSSS